MHPKFNGRNIINDIALIFLSDEVPDQPNIGTICLPPRNHVFDGSNCLASGWGKTSFDQEEKYPAILKKIELSIVPFASCEEKFRQTLLGKYFKLHKSFICAAGDNESVISK